MTLSLSLSLSLSNATTFRKFEKVDGAAPINVQEVVHALDACAHVFVCALKEIEKHQNVHEEKNQSVHGQFSM